MPRFVHRTGASAADHPQLGFAIDAGPRVEQPLASARLARFRDQTFEEGKTVVWLGLGDQARRSPAGKDHPAQ